MRRGVQTFLPVGGDHPIGLLDVTGGGAISLEPGGQFELSGAPLETLHETAIETAAHLAQVKQVADPLGIRFLGLGMSPDEVLVTSSLLNWSWAKLTSPPTAASDAITPNNLFARIVVPF